MRQFEARPYELCQCEGRPHDRDSDHRLCAEAEVVGAADLAATARKRQGKALAARRKATPAAPKRWRSASASYLRRGVCLACDAAGYLASKAIRLVGGAGAMATSNRERSMHKTMAEVI